LAQLDYEGVSCHFCRKTSQEEGVTPDCINNKCPTGFDLLPPKALRLLKIRSLLVSLNDLHLADRICNECSVNLDDLEMLADIETMLKKIRPVKGQENG
jgi:hypothetical protein